MSPLLAATGPVHGPITLGEELTPLATINKKVKELNMQDNIEMIYSAALIALTTSAALATTGIAVAAPIVLFSLTPIPSTILIPLCTIILVCALPATAFGLWGVAHFQVPFFKRAYTNKKERNSDEGQNFCRELTKFRLGDLFIDDRKLKELFKRHQASVIAAEAGQQRGIEEAWKYTAINNYIEKKLEERDNEE